MAYKVIILYQLYMPSYFLGTFTEYPELVGFFVSLGIPPKTRFDGQNGGNTPTKIWQKYEIFPRFSLH